MKPVTISVRDVCRLSGISRTTVFSLLKEGRLDRRKIGRRTLISVESFERLFGDLQLEEVR